MPSPSFELKPTIYRAGAGAGKTTKLVSHVLDVARQSKAQKGVFPKIVVTTFTRKATQELRERLLKKVENENDSDLLSYIVSKDRLHISTIHGVLNLLLTKYGTHINLDPGFTFIEPSESLRRSKRILRKLIFATPKWTRLLELYGFNPLIKKIIAYEKEMRLLPELKGLTREDIENKIQEHVNTLSHRMLDLSQSIASETKSEGWLTFSEQLKSLTELMGDYRSHRSVLLEALKSIRKPAYSKKNPQVSDEINSEAEKIKKNLSDLKNENFDFENAKALADCYELIESLGREFHKVVNEERLLTGKIEIDDLEILSLSLMRSNPEVAKMFSESWDYWLIDEYQDTSPLQVELMRLMIGKSPYFLVGDPQQSIYYFRGARSEVFVQAEEKIRSLHGELHVLDRNYRSEPELLLCINDLVEKMGDGFTPMRPREELSKYDSHKNVLTVGRVSTLEEEIRFVTQKVQSLISQGVRLSEITVLAKKYRHLNYFAKAFSEAKIPCQVHTSSGFSQRQEVRDILCFLKFLVNPHDDKNLVSLLRSPWFLMPDSDMTCKNIVKRESSLWRQLQLIQNELSKAAQETMSALLSALEDARQFGILTAFEMNIMSSGIIDFCYYHDSTGQRESNVWKLLAQLRDSSKDPGFNVLSFINASSSHLSLEDVGADANAAPAFEPSRVNLMTIHMSKGLQFEHVFVPFLNLKTDLSKKPSFFVEPKMLAWGCDVPLGNDGENYSTLYAEDCRDNKQREELKESHRLFYVAVTRAKSRLYLSFHDKVEKNSWLESLRFDFSESHTTSSYTYTVETECPSSILQATLNKKSTEILSRYKGSHREELGLRKVSVTELLESEVSESRLRAKKNVDVTSVAEKAIKGTRIHKVFESLHYMGLDSVKDPAVDYVLSLSMPPMCELISHGNVEWGFLSKVGRCYLEGQIDLWGQVGEEIWIVDYKSGSSSYKEKALEQLKIYATALKLAGHSGRFKICALYPYSEEVYIEDFDNFEEIIKKF